MRLISKKFSGVRRSKSNTPEIVTTPTEGTTRFNEHVAEILGVDYNKVLSKAGQRIEIASLTAEGDLGIENKAIALLPEGSTEGNKLASPNKKTSGTIQFNGAASWKALGGSVDTNTTFRIDEETNVVDLDKDGNYITLQQAIDSKTVKNGCWAKTATYIENKGTADEEEVILHKIGDPVIVWYILQYVSTNPKVERKKNFQDELETV